MKYYSFLCLFIFGATTLIAQVGIGTINPDSSAILEINSETSGVLFPRMTSEQIDDIVDPAIGLLVYNTDLNEFQFNSSITVTPDWSKISHSASVKYSNQDINTNINTLIYTDIPIFGNIEWNDNNNLFNQSGNLITISTTGRYIVNVNVAYEVANAQSGRVAIQAQIAIDGTPSGALGNSGYIRGNTQHSESSLHISEVFNITAGQTISIQTKRSNTNVASSNFTSIGTSNIYIEKIK